MRKAKPEGQESTEPSPRSASRVRTRSQVSTKDARHVSIRSNEEPALPRHSLSTRSSPGKMSGASPAKKPPTVKRSFTTDQYGQPNTPRGWSNGHHLPPIPASPYTTEASTPSSRKSLSTPPANVAANGSPVPRPSSRHKEKEKERRLNASTDIEDNSPSRSRAKSSSYVPHRSPVPQSLNAAVEMLSLSDRRAASDTGHGPPPATPPSAMDKPRPSTTTRPKEKAREAPHTPSKPASGGGFWMARSMSNPPAKLGKTISNPVLNQGTRVICRYFSWLIVSLRCRGHETHERHQGRVRKADSNHQTVDASYSYCHFSLWVSTPHVCRMYVGSIPTLHSLARTPSSHTTLRLTSSNSSSLISQDSISRPIVRASSSGAKSPSHR